MPTSGWSVSYTHLDVYKRQECGRPDAVLAAIRTDEGFSAAEEDKVAAFGVASVDHGFTSLLPVSYTHLDVYKRQVHGSSP